MRPLAIAIAVILSAEYASQELMDSLDDVLVYPIEVPRNIEKRDTVKKSESNYFYDFIEEKLIEHSQALEHLVKEADRSEELLKQLIENISKNINKPKMPEKVEVKELLTRRSYGGGPAIVPTQENDNVISPWCSVALICKRTINPVCGYDDNFGYGKFDDLCHLLQVNCYWKYNFALVPSCRPNL